MIQTDTNESILFPKPRAIELGRRLQALGLAILRYGLVLLLILGGLSKWTPSEAEGIRSWIEHSPFLSWLYRATSVQGASILIGVIEVITALAILTRRWAPRLSAAGSANAVAMFVITLSFLVTTPNQGPDAQGFLMKDLFLLGAAMWCCGEAMEASNQ